MGTIQPFGPGDNNLYTYNPLKDSNDQPPTVSYVETYLHVLNFTICRDIMSC